MNRPGEGLTLHGYFRSSAAYRVRIALNMKNIPHSHVAYHLRKGEQRSEAYLRLNPQGLVPSIQSENLILTQSLAIIEYLDECYPEPPLLPQNTAARARVRALSSMIACDIHPINNLRVIDYLRTVLKQPEDEVRRWYAHWITIGFEAIESQLNNSDETGRFCHGDTPTLADICLIPQVANARNFGVDLQNYSTILRIVEAAVAVPAFEKALPANQADAE
ncbi:MAG: maleylacetoacetate isomerase [Sphingobium sp.]